MSLIYCACGCGQKREEFDLWGRKKFYINGHNRRGKHPSGKTREKMSDSHKDIPLSPTTKQKISDASKGIPKSEKHKQHMRKPKTREHNQKVSDSHKGDKCYAWKGGISFLPYCSKFNDDLKEKIRDRDNRICQLCFKTEVENNRKLSIHHIHYDKENCYPDLISLCTSCNFKVNIDRDYWEELFMKILKYGELI